MLARRRAVNNAMTFATLLRNILLHLSIRWLLTHLDTDPTPPASEQPASTFFDPDFLDASLFNTEEDAPENAFAAFNNLPPPPTVYTPQANLEHILISVPKGIGHEQLNDLRAIALTHPTTAEAIRWGLLKTLEIQPDPNTTPIDAWLDYTSRISNTPVTLEILGRRRDLSKRAIGWIRFLIGVDTDPQRLDDIPEDEL